MSTLTAQMTIINSEKRTRTVLLEGSGSVPDAQITTGSGSLTAGQTKTLTFTKLISLYFPKPTLIHLTIGSDTVDATVKGAMVLPCAGVLVIENPADTTATDPTTFSYVLA